MFTPKYYKAIEEAQHETRHSPNDILLPFDLDDLGADSWRRRAFLWLKDLLLPPIFFLLREFWPIARFGRFVIVTRAGHVCDVLRRPDIFEVPYGREMSELAGGSYFVLGAEGERHRRQNALIRSVLLPGDADHVRELSNRFARALIRTSGGRIDVMKDFITRVASETCIRYFGLQVDDPDAFAEWAMSISALLFADPCGNPATRRTALNGSARLRAVIDRSIADMKSVDSPDLNTVLGRLIKLQEKGQPTDEEIRAVLVGLVTGFIPTNTLAAGKILQELQRRPDAMDKAMKKARRARKIDDENLKRFGHGGNARRPEHVNRASLEDILLEAARLNPALAPGQWRYAKEEAIIAPDGERPRKVRKGSLLVVATMSALRDRRAVKFPSRFRLDRKPGSADLIFGDGTHSCLGKHLAMAQITETFLVLLSQTNLRRPKWSLRWWRGIRWVGPFPRWFDMEFDPEMAPATQTMMTICAPLADDDDRHDVEKEIAGLGNPATETAKRMLDQTGIVHFASLSVIEAGDASEPAPHLLLELNVDGPVDAALRSIADADAAGGNRLRSIFRNTPRGDEPLADILRHYMLDLKARPWGSIGLTFNGTSEFPVKDIAMHDALSTFSKEALQLFMKSHANLGRRAMAALRFVRMLINKNEVFVRASRDPKYDDRAKVELLLQRAAGFSDFLIVPSRKRLQVSDWKDRTHAQALVNFAKSWAFWRLFIPMIIVTLLLGSVVFSVLTVITLIGLYGALILAVLGGLAASGLLWGLVAAGFLALLRYHENKDIPDDRNPKLADIRKIARVENRPGFVQNHFMAVTPLKSGWFRKVTLAFSLWGIGQLVINFFRPGFVLNMGTIHYAKWFRLPGRDKLIFQANYDGSWESYLEDFIMKAHPGQTAAWCNGIGFPRTKFLIEDGAQDGDRFKRWVRRQQILAQFWYSRFSYLTTDQIRNGALIHDGLARATTDTAARAWLDCFGSMQRPDYTIETEEVQSLVFRGQVNLLYVVCALIKLPPASEGRSNWLHSLVRNAGTSHGGALTQHPEGRCGITFGDHPFTTVRELQDKATFVAFTASGLEKLGVPGAQKPDGLGTFPNTFNLGMANRSSVLGDFGKSAPEKWRWTDADCAGSEDASRPATVDAVILIYAKSVAECKRMLDHHTAPHMLGKQVVVDEIYTGPATDRIKYDEPEAQQHSAKAADREKSRAPTTTSATKAINFEHFGFHDGVSQPVIRGTQRFSKGALPRDIVEPGEFILGYRNNQNYYPPTATVSAETDLDDHLPTPLTDMPSRFPSFENSDTARDFGRNGSFLVIRQLAQDVGGFKDFIEQKAAELNENYINLADVVGAPVDAKWVAAKMMGRWPDGTSLVTRPGADKDDAPRKRRANDFVDGDNDFSYGVDDPQGLHCPLGAHVRRANPRDSLQPEDPMQQSIINRHRLLRRGRTYDYQLREEGKEKENGKEKARDKEKDKEKGLLFTCLCADLDRQFEFVQQTWIGSPSFHGLRDEPDPISAWHDPDNHVFTIPTPSGPIQLDRMQSFVTVRAGGYFFLPSRSAIQYLTVLDAGLEKQVIAAPANPSRSKKAAVEPQPSRRPGKARRRRQS